MGLVKLCSGIGQIRSNVLQEQTIGRIGKRFHESGQDWSGFFVGADGIG